MKPIPNRACRFWEAVITSLRHVVPFVLLTWLAAGGHAVSSE
jgi:hypothetical protein